MFKFKEYDFKHYKVSILVIILFLGSIGSYLIQYLQDSGEQQFEKQIIGLLAGALIAFFVSLFDYHFICKFFGLLYLLNLILLVAVQYSPFGAYHYEAKRWLRFPNGQVPSTEAIFEFQPSELTKIILILFFAKFFDLMYRQINKWYVIVISAILAGIPLLLIFKQPDLSTTIVLGCTYIAILYATGLSYKIIVPSLAIGLPLIIALYWYVQQPFQGLLTEYQQNRILSIKYPELYPKEMWQQNNAAKAIKSGGMLGKIFTEHISKLECKIISAIESDFIFTAIAEGFGFVGCCIVILLFLLLIMKCFGIAKRAKDRLGKLIAIGVATLIMTQVFVNIGVVTSILPNTGIPLPFVSSGLSALLSNMLMIGILLNVSLQGKWNKEV